MSVSDFVNDDDNTIDPLEVVAHQGPHYEVKILREQGSDIDNYPEGVRIVYPGTKRSKFIIRPLMPGTDGIINGQAAAITVSM